MYIDRVVILKAILDIIPPPGKSWNYKHSEIGFGILKLQKISLYVKQDNSVGKIEAGLVNPRTSTCIPVCMLYAPCWMCIYMYMYV